MAKPGNKSMQTLIAVPFLRPRWGMLALALVALLLQGCATVARPDKRDPLESVNRSVFAFNDAVDAAVVKPVATAYRDVVPSLVRKGVGNFFNNLEDVWSIVNNAIQGRRMQTGHSIGRVMVNSTVGLLGLVDVASDLNIERHTTGFGMTLGRWGVPPGPYVVMPLLGPSTLREVAALPVDRQGNALTYVDDETTRTVLTATKLINLRAKYLSAGDVVAGAALDKYSFTRDSYLQRQRNQQYDGNPPDDDGDTESEKP
jgi:phospholipid-binding lipoprotein MlaA